MSRIFGLNDRSIVVVVGSGAGGGTLANELAQHGVDVVCLEAGSRLTMNDIVNDNDAMFRKVTWLDKRIGSGDLNADMPLFVCKTVGGTTMRWGRRSASVPRTRIQDADNVWSDLASKSTRLAVESQRARAILRNC